MCLRWMSVSVTVGVVTISPQLYALKFDSSEDLLIAHSIIYFMITAETD